MFDLDKLISEAYDGEAMSFEKLAEMVENMMILQESLGISGVLNENQEIDSDIKEFAPFIEALDKLVFVMPTEQTGMLGTEQRKQFERFVSNNIAGNTLKEGIANLNNFAKEGPKPAEKINEILANIGTIRIAKRMIEDYTDSSAGFVFEYFLAALYSGKQIGEIGQAEGSLPIEDVMLSVNPRTGKGGQPVSLKLLKSTTDIHGSLENLLHFYTKPEIADRAKDVGIEYIVGIKYKSDQIGVYSFNINPVGEGKDNFFYWMKPEKYFDWEKVNKAWKSLTGNTNGLMQEAIDPRRDFIDNANEPKELVQNYDAWTELIKQSSGNKLIKYFGYNPNDEYNVIFTNPNEVRPGTPALKLHSTSTSALRNIKSILSRYEEALGVPKLYDQPFFKKYGKNLKVELPKIQKEIIEKAKSAANDKEALGEINLFLINQQKESDLYKSIIDALNEQSKQKNNAADIAINNIAAKLKVAQATLEEREKAIDDRKKNKDRGPTQTQEKRRISAQNNVKTLDAKLQNAQNNKKSIPEEILDTPDLTIDQIARAQNVENIDKLINSFLSDKIKGILEVWNKRIRGFLEAASDTAPGFGYSTAHFKRVLGKYDPISHKWFDPKVSKKVLLVGGRIMPRTPQAITDPKTVADIAADADSKLKVNDSEVIQNLQKWLLGQLKQPMNEDSSLLSSQGFYTADDQQDRIVVGKDTKGAISYAKPKRQADSGQFSPADSIRIWAMALRAGLKEKQFSVTSNIVQSNGTYYGTMKVSDAEVKEFFKKYGDMLKEKCVPIYENIFNFTKTMNNYFLVRGEEGDETGRAKEITDAVAYAGALHTSAQNLAEEKE